MTCPGKGRITTNLVQLALLLIFLNGEFPLSYNNRSHYNNFHDTEYFLGSSGGYAQTYFPRRGYFGHDIHPKSVENFGPFSFDFNSHDFIDDVLEPRVENILNQYISPRTNLPKSIPALQNVTAYVLSDSTTANPQAPILPIRLDRNNFLLSINADVPERSNVTENQVPSIFNLSESAASSTVQVENIARNEASEDLGFHLVSGNIVFLSEEAGDTNQSSIDSQPFLESLRRLNSELNPEEAEVKIEYSVDGSSSSDSALHPRLPNLDTPWSPRTNLPEENSERLWELLRNDAEQYDEDFSLGMVLDDDFLSMGMDPIFTGELGYHSEEEEAVIRPSAMHEDEDVGEASSGSSAGTLESFPRNQEGPASGWNEVEDAAAALESFLDDLETESGILILDSSDDQLDLPLVESSEHLESESGPSNSPESVPHNESSYVSCESLSEIGDEELDAAVNTLDMIQTASIYSNGRSNTHPTQPRGFQVHARMQGLLRNNAMDPRYDQRWQELASLLSLQPQHDGNGTSLAQSLPQALPHHFPPHHHHHHHHGLHHPSSSLHHHHSMHHPHHHHPSYPTGGGPPPVSYGDSTRSVLLQNATLPVPPPELNTTSSYSSVPMGPPPNIGSALASSMHLTNSSDPMIDPSSHYKMIEPPHHDMIYYPNMTTNGEMHNQTTEGFLSSILNDDDLQLMDMAMNEGMYTMRLMDNSSGAVANGPGTGPPGMHPHPVSSQTNCSIGAGAAAASEDRMEASSDSAVSSMGSDRVPPMTDPQVSDTEWTESDAQAHGPHDSSYGAEYSSKLRGYDYYGKGDGLHRVGGPVAQKKHQMFGKRVQHDQGVILPYSGVPHSSSGLCGPYTPDSIEHSGGNASMDHLDMKYSCNSDYSRHDGPRTSECMTDMHNNHSYALPQSQLPVSTHSHSLRTQRTPTKDKPKKEYLSRDEKRARSMNLPITTDDIINLPMDEFNERLSKYDLSEPQLSLIRDIRRRGKNKVAAQNCRKRKLDQILQLADEVQKIRDRKLALLRDQENLVARRNALKEKYSQLYRHVFQALRDRDGNPYSPYEYSLQQAADGNIILVPRNAIHASTSSDHDSLDPNLRRGKTKDEIKKDGSA